MSIMEENTIGNEDKKKSRKYGTQKEGMQKIILGWNLVLFTGLRVQGGHFFFCISMDLVPRLEVAMQHSRLHLTCRVNVPIEFGNLHFLIEILLIDKGR